MDILSIVLQMILSLSLLVVLHECGHFFPARWFNTKVEKFYLFFNPYFSLFKKKIGDTEYGIGWVPFGGYVKIAGMIDESMDKEQLLQPPQPWEFRSKKAWQRLIIMVGGVTVNFILGFLIFAGLLWHYGESYLPTAKASYGISVDSIGTAIGLRDGDQVLKIGDKAFDRFIPGLLREEIVINDIKDVVVQRGDRQHTISIDPKWAGFLSSHENSGWSVFSSRIPAIIEEVGGSSPAKTANIRPGDEIVAVNGNDAHFVHVVQRKIQQSNSPLTVTVNRGGQLLTKTVALDEESKRIGVVFRSPDQIFEFSRDKYTLAQAIPGGVNKGIDFLSKQLSAFGQMFKGRIKVTESLGSVISITKLFDPAWSWERFWRITAMLSILLGFFNLLPIPALDGGYIMFLFYELISGRKPSDKFMEYATLFGFIIMVSLMIFALGLDIKRLF